MRALVGFWRLLLGALWLSAVAVLTLRSGPIDAEWLAEIPRLCAICGTRGTADAILNVALFLPLGLVLGGGGGRRAALTAFLAGGTIALGIELLQTTLPGRHSSPTDVVLNAAGAGLGTFVYSLVVARLSDRPLGGGWPWWGGAVGACFLVGGILMTPWPTDDDYWGQWMPDLGHMPRYQGRVLSAELNGRPLPFGRIDHGRPHRELLQGDWELSGHIVIGAEPPAVSPILSIYDGQQREVLLLGAHRDALVFRERTLGDALRFDSPDIRLPGAFDSPEPGAFDSLEPGALDPGALDSLEPGDSTTIGARRSAAGTCLRVGSTEECGVGVTPGRTWGLLLYVEGPGVRARALLDLLWLCGLFLPVGFFAGRRGELVRAALLGVGGLILAVALTPLVVGPWYELVACFVGVGLGWRTRLFLAAVSRRAGGGPDGQPARTMASNV